MSGLLSGLHSCVSGLRGVAQSVNCRSRNIAVAGAVASKKYENFMSVINSSQSIHNFTPSGVTSTVQGNIAKPGDATNSDVTSHLSITAAGFFVTSNVGGGLAEGGTIGFTRVGTFAEDAEKRFVNHAGQYLQIFETDAEGNIVSPNETSVSQMKTASTAGLSGRSKPTTTAKVAGILKSTETVDPTVNATGSMGDPKIREKMAFTVFDSLGVEHTLNFLFAKVAEQAADPLLGTPGSQTWTVTVEALPLTEASSYNDIYLSTHHLGAGNTPGVQIVFDENGAPKSINGGTVGPPTNNAPPLVINWATSAAPSIVEIDFGNIGEKSGLRVIGSQYDLTQPIKTNGNGPGKYQGTTFTKDGFLVANYDKGDPEKYGKIALATFPAINNLLEQTGGVYLATPESGNYILNFPNQGGVGAINPGTYEGSTIDTTEEFTSLIVDQQLYTANLKGISIIDEMLRALAQLGR